MLHSCVAKVKHFGQFELYRANCSYYHRRRNPPGYPAMAGRPRVNAGYYPAGRVLPGKKTGTTR